jgi:hypothetical protein
MRIPRALKWRWVWEGAHRQRLRHRLLRASRRSQQHAIRLTAAIGVERGEKKIKVECVILLLSTKEGRGREERGKVRRCN